MVAMEICRKEDPIAPLTQRTCLRYNPHGPKVKITEIGEKRIATTREEQK